MGARKSAARRTPDVGPTLAAADIAVEESRWADASARLVEAWQAVRSGRIARALALVDARLLAPAPLEETRVNRREAEWLDYAKVGDEDTLRRILAVPWPVHPQQAAARFEALSVHASPRISNALLGLYRSARYTSVAGNRLYRAIFHYLVEHDDHAVVEELERAKDSLVERRRLGAAVFKRKKPRAPEFTAAAEAALDRIERAFAHGNSSTREALLAAVYETPHDDAPRIVYADALSEDGDLRGEFITLQLARGAAPPSRREKALVKAAGRRWFDGLDDDGAVAIELARGFPIAAQLRGPGLRAAAWATIERLILVVDVLPKGTERLRGLRRLDNLRTGDIGALELPYPELEMLSLYDYEHGLEADTTLAPKTIALRNPSAPDPLATHARRLPDLPIGRRVETVQLGLAIRSLGTAIAIAEDTGLAIEIAGWWDADAPAHWAARVTPSRLELAWTGTAAYADLGYESIPPVIAGLARPGFDTVVVRGLREGEVRDRVETAIRKWSSVKTLELLP